MQPTATAASPAPRCLCCGYPTTPAGCSQCTGSVRSLGAGYDLRPGRGLALADAWRGVREVYRALFALLHERAYIGQLRLPVVANLLSFLLLFAGGTFVLAPLFVAAFVGPWWLADGWRAAVADQGPARWLLTTALLLGPPLLDVTSGGLQEPLRAATERTMLGPRGQDATEHGVLRLRERAQVLAAALLALPFALLLVLVPWGGLPAILVLGAAAAAIVWFEPPMAVRGYALRERLWLLWRNRWRALGVGAGLQLAVFVPFVNVLALAPIATIAATSAFLQFDRRAAS